MNEKLVDKTRNKEYNWRKLRKKENKMKAHYIAGGLFALYMAFIGVLANFKFNGIMNIILMF